MAFDFGIGRFFRRIGEYLGGGVWDGDVKGMCRAKRFSVNFLRFVTLSGKGFVTHRCGLHAAGLTYYSLLAFVPILCLLLLLAKTLGAGDFARQKINGQIDSLISEIENGQNPNGGAERFIDNIGSWFYVPPEAGPSAKVCEDKPLVAPEPETVLVPETPLEQVVEENQKIVDAPEAVVQGEAAPEEPADALALDIAAKEAELLARAADEKAAAETRKLIARKKAARELGSKLREISNTVFDKIDSFNVDTLGWIGMVMLIWTVISTLGMVEHSCNEIWEVKKARPLWKQCFLYVFISVVLPLLIAGALSVPILRLVVRGIELALGQLEMTKVVGSFLIGLLQSKFVGFLLSYFFASLAFACFYLFMPNIKVMPKAALKSGCITSLMFFGWLKLCAVAQVGVANSSALYGSFAFFPIMLAWLYVSWQIILLGSVFSYAFQCVHIGRPRIEP